MPQLAGWSLPEKPCRALPPKCDEMIVAGQRSVGRSGGPAGARNSWSCYPETTGDLPMLLPKDEGLANQTHRRLTLELSRPAKRVRLE